MLLLRRKTAKELIKIPSDLELMSLMRRCGHLLHHRYPTNMSQNRILTILKNEGPMKQRELMERMNIQAGSLSEIIAKVECGGFVERTRCEDDKRNFELTLTDAGRERAEVFERERSDLATELFSVLDEQQKETLFDILGILHEKWVVGHCCCHRDSCKPKNETEKESENPNA